MKKRIIAGCLTLVMCGNLMFPATAGAKTIAAQGSGRTDVASDAVTLESPDPKDDLTMTIWLEEGTPYYRVTLNGFDLVEKSKLGMNTKDIGSFESGFTVGDIQVKDVVNEPWEPIVGEQESVEDQYQEAVIPLTNENGTLTIEARVYDTGVAFRYDLPDIPEGQGQYVIGSGDEKTQFAFPEGTYAYRHIGQNQTKPSKTSVDNLGSNIYRPMTLTYENGYAMTICEANLDNYSVLKLENDSSNPRTAKVALAGDVTVRAEEAYIESKHYTAPAGPEVSPWRAMVIGEFLTDLAQNNTLTQLLNEPADEETYQFSEWVEAGSCQRVMRGDNDDTNVMNNDYIETLVDQAAERGYRYVLLDTGWNGPENDPNCDPRLDPTKLEPEKYESDKILQEQYFARPEEYADTFLGNGEGCFYTRGQGFKKYGSLGDGGDMQVDIDIPAVCDYANKKGVGIILYVNGTRFFPDDMSGDGGRYRFTPDELFTYFERWGVAGVKPGFVESNSQNNELYMQEVIEAAARHKLVMTVHDVWVPSGIERTYPNLLTAEGIYGDEEKGNVSIPEDISTIFTRTIQGPADHTFCWPGKATKGYALASPIMFRTGLNLLFWYTNTLDIPDKDKEVIDFYDDLPSTWKKTLYLEGEMQGYATIARQSFASTRNDGTAVPSRWYIGSLSAIDRMLTIPLDFLDEGQYVAEIYFDGPDADPDAGFNSAAKKEQTLLKETYLVDKDTTLIYNMKAKYGYSVRLTKAEDYGDISGIQGYDKVALQSLLAVADGLEAPGYETVAWKNLQEAVETGRALMENESATEEEVKAAAARLNEALNAYLPTTSLIEAISGTSRLIPGYYTKESWEVLEKAVEEGMKLLENVQASEEELNAAAEAVKAAIDGLAEDLMATKELAAYLSDFDYDESKSWNGDTYDPVTGEGNKMDKVWKDKNRAGGDMKLVIGGETRTYERGIGMDAPGELYYDLSGKDYAFFEATVGIDAERLSKSDGMIFYVYGDGELLCEVPITGSKEPQNISVPIAGVKELLIATNQYGSSSNDWANWADARFMTVKNSEGDYEYVNVALNKPVEVTSIEKPENDKSYINDGDENTRWAASSSNYPQSAVIDLGDEYDILQFVTNFYNKSGDRYYTYNIYTSSDNETWELCIDKSGNTTFGLNKDRTPENTRARYVKLEVTGSSNPSGYASVYEFQVMTAVPEDSLNQKEELEKFIAMIKELEASEYTPESWAALEQAVQAAEAVLADVEATQKEIDEAYANLVVAFGGLEYGVQKLHLEMAIQAAEEILALGENYEDEDIEGLKAAVEAGREVLAKQNPTQEEVNAAADAVLDELFKLSKKADIQSLESLIAAAKELLDGKYTSDSLANLQDAIERAEAVVADQDREQTDISNAYVDLVNAIRNMEMKGNKAALKAVMEKAEEILANADDYAASTIEGLEEELESAKAVYANEDAVQSEVNEAVEALTLKITQARLMGDVNGDGEITTGDTTSVLKAAAELTVLSAEEAESADVNGDGKTDTSDAVRILQYASEKIRNF